jgi:hypothetical protein
VFVTLICFHPGVAQERLIEFVVEEPDAPAAFQLHVDEGVHPCAAAENCSVLPDHPEIGPLMLIPGGPACAIVIAE